MVRFTTFSFHVFWSKLNSYSRFCNNSGGKIDVRRFLVFDFSSFSRIHHFLLSKIQISKFQKFKDWKAKPLRFPKFRNSWVSELFETYFPICSRVCSLIFLDVIQVFWCNKMKKYGLPEPKTSIIHEMLSFRPLMPWNRDFISLPWRRKIQLRH